MNKNEDNQNYKVMVTGASEGIGREFVKQLAASSGFFTLSGKGCQITAVARNEKRLAELCEQIGEQHRYIVADLNQAEDLRRLQDELANNRYNLLVNNAGFGTYQDFVSTDLERVRSMIGVNVLAPVVLAHTFLQGAGEGDSLINVSSTLAYLPSPSAGVYAATKAFVSSFSKSLWYEQKKKGVYVLELCPGITRSKFHQRSGGKEESFPEKLAEEPAELVKKALKVLEKRKAPVFISGAINRLFVRLISSLPAKTIVNLMGRSGFG